VIFAHRWLFFLKTKQMRFGVLSVQCEGWYASFTLVKTVIGKIVVIKFMDYLLSINDFFIYIFFFSVHISHLWFSIYIFCAYISPLVFVLVINSTSRIADFRNIYPS
jgi:hypothetical protein